MAVQLSGSNVMLIPVLEAIFPLWSSRPSERMRIVGPLASVLAASVLCSCGGGQPNDDGVVEATIRVDASQRLNPISELLYGQFAEFMFEDIKGGLWAELIVNRGFEDVAPPPAAAHYWERYPDTRNHANGFLLGGKSIGVSEQGYPSSFENRAQVLVNSLPEQMGHGIYQSAIPVRSGLTYRGSVWLRAEGVERTADGLAVSDAFEGSVRVSLEEDRSGGKIYGAHELSDIPGEWTRFEFELSASESDPLARFVFRMYGWGRSGSTKSH